MRYIFLLLCLSLGPSAMAAVVDTGAKSVIVDYPEALQKAGVKNIKCIFKDSRGFIWIGTENGLYRFDGTNTDLLEHETGNKHSIPNNKIVSIAEDKQGNIWAGTMLGAAKINAESLGCTVYNKSFNNLGDDFDVKIRVGSSGKIWAGTSKGISLLFPGENKFKNVWAEKAGGSAAAGYVTCLAEWKNDTLIAGTFNGLVLLNKKNFGYRRLNPIKDKLTVTSLFTDHLQRLWIGAWAYGCLIGDKNLTHFATYAWEKVTKDEGAANIVTDIVGTDYNGAFEIWVSTSRGVYQIREGGSREDFKAIEITGHDNGFIRGLMADDEQYIWEAGSAVSRFFAGNSPFGTIPVHPGGSVDELQQLNIRGRTAIAFSSWYSPGGLLISSADGKHIFYKRGRQRNSAAGDVSGIVKDKFGRFWVATFDGVQLLDSLFRPIVPGKPPGDYPGLASLKSNAIAIRHDTVWIGCYKDGIRLYSLDFRLLRAFRPGDGSGLSDNLIERFFTGRNGDFWVCGDFFLYQYNSATGKFRLFNFDNDENWFNPHNIAQLPGGDYLVASGMGLFRFKPGKAYSQIASPLVNREKDVPDLSVDKEGNIWYLNNNHLVYYQVKQKHFTLYGAEDGLNAHGGLACLRTFNGTDYYLSEGNTIITFSRLSQQANKKPIVLYVHSVEVNDSTLNRGGVIQGPLKLKYNENKIKFTFGAINYIKPGQNLYAYRLSGVDSRWVYTTENSVSYTNVSPGGYTFFLKAENYAGLWSKPVSLDVVVDPPYWATWWFRAISIILISSVVFVAIRYVLQRNLREKILYLEKEKAVEQERNRIARDMHDDLGSGLTKIAVMSEVTKAQLGNRQSATEYLDVISSASRELVDNLQDIIWVLNPKNDSVESLALYLKEYTESFFEHTPVILQFNYRDGSAHISLSEEKRRNIFLVVKESCNNALKHAGCTLIHIDIKINDRYLLVEMADNGRGFGTDHIALFSNGLQNMKNRIRQIGGDFQLVSAPGDGTRISCSIPV